MRVAFLGGVRLFFGRFDGDFCAFRRFRKFSLVSNGFRPFSAALIRCRTFSCGFRRFPKIAQKEAPPKTHREIRGSAGAPGRVRACPGVSGRGRCPGVSGRQKNNAGIASWVSGWLSTATPCPGASGRSQGGPRRVRARGARAPAARGIPRDLAENKKQSRKVKQNH